MTEDPRKKMNDVRQEIDIRLDGLLGELGKTIGEVVSRLENASGEVRRSHSFDIGKGPVRAEAGIRIRMGGEEFTSATTPSARPPAKETPTPAKPSAREISATVFEEDGFWSLSAELPGMSEEDLTLKVENGTLTIFANGLGRTYSGEFDIPAHLTRADLTVSLRNGILDLSADTGAAN